MYSSASAATFTFSFLADGDVTPGGAVATNINDYVEIGSGTVEINDAVIAPNAFITFASGGVTGFTASILDDLGVTLTYDLADDANNFDDDNFGVQLDDAGNFERFETPDFSFCSGCFFIFDDEFPAPFRTTQGAGLMLVDEEPTFGFLTEDVTRFGSTFSEGDVVRLSDFLGAPVTPFANTFTIENSEINSFASGYLLVDKMTTGIAPVPLPASLPIFLAGLGAFAVIRRHRPTA